MQSIVDQSTSDPVWDEAHIEARTQELAKLFLVLWPTFKERLPVNTDKTTATDSDDILSRFSDEQLADPVELMNAI